MKTLRWLLSSMLGLTLLIAAGAPAQAHMGAERFRQEKRASVPPQGPRGQLAMRSLTGGDQVRLLRENDNNEYTGAFEVKNTGPGPLTVNRVFVLDAEDDPRAVQGITVLPENASRAPIPPGNTRRYRVTWRASESRASELSALLVVDTDAAQPGATVVDPPRLIGVMAQRRLGLARHWPLALVLWPLLAALLALLSRLWSGLDARKLRAAAIVVFAAQAVAAAWVFVAFDRDLGRRDGNEGLQMIERVVIDARAGLELYLGVDGVSVGVVLAVALVALVVVLTSTASLLSRPRELAAAAVLVSGAMLTALAQTSLLFVLGWAMATSAAVVISLAVTRRAALHMGFVALVSTALLAWAAQAMATHAGAVYLSDGSESASAYALPDLGRAHFDAVTGSLLGLPVYRALWLLGFVACGMLMALPPVMGWLACLWGTGEKRGDRDGDARWSMLAAAVLPALGAYGMLRLLLVLPEGGRWGAESLPVVGAVLVLLGGLLAVVETDLRRIALHLTVARSGLFLLAAFSTTPEGLGAASGLVMSYAVASVTLHLATQRATGLAGEDAIERIGGLGRSAPLLATGLLAGLIGLSGIALPGMSGLLLGELGSFGRRPILTLVASVGLVLVALGLARAARVVFGDAPALQRRNKRLEPFGGAIPDLHRSDAPGWLVLAVFLVLLALGSRTFAGASEQVIRDVFPRFDPDAPTRVALSAGPTAHRA